jgi:hypothetical protein
MEVIVANAFHLHTDNTILLTFCGGGNFPWPTTDPSGLSSLISKLNPL